MKFGCMNKVALGLFVSLLTFGPAHSQTAEQVHADYREIGKAQAWSSIYRPGEDGTGKALCAIYSRPNKAQVFKVGEAVEAIRGEMAAFVNWNDKAPNIVDGEISFMMGVPVSEGIYNNHAVVIDGQYEFSLIGVGDRLYVKPEDDEKIVKAIRNGLDMVVTGSLQDGTTAKDTYSLKGVVAATKLSVDNCK